MYLSLRYVTLMIFIVSYVFAQNPAENRLSKSENGLALSWGPAIATDPNANQIEISDEQGHTLATLKVLRLVPDAQSVSVYDVSARRNLIAVAAVFASKEAPKIRPAATLLIFNLSGQLLSAQALEPSHQIERLAVDDNSNIWTLTSHAYPNADPSKAPMVVEYSVDGKITREILPRSLFPFHASDLRQDIEMGAPAMGYGAGMVWFWLPGSTDLVTISSTSGEVAMTKTQLPTKAGRNAVPTRIARDSSGKLIAQVGEHDDQGKRVAAHYTWSPTAGWERFRPGQCEGGVFMGVREEEQVYRVIQGDRTNICVFSQRPSRQQR
jgi:hypothetical protein